MSYFDEVYQKRINAGGTNRQDRIKSRKEAEFNKVFMKRTEYKVSIVKTNDIPCKRFGSLQPNGWNENKIISNLLIPTSAPSFDTGDVLHIIQEIKDQRRENVYIVVFVEQNITKGYQLFKLICLDELINITDEYGNSKLVTPVKFMNASQSFMQDTLTRNAKELGYREPQTTRIVVTKDSDELKKGQYFNFKERGWEIVGIDNISIPNVAYLFISERLVDDDEPRSSEQIPIGFDDNFFLIGR